MMRAHSRKPSIFVQLQDTGSTEACTKNTQNSIKVSDYVCYFSAAPSSKVKTGSEEFHIQKNTEQFVLFPYASQLRQAPRSLYLP